MKIAICSDLHLEFEDTTIQNPGDVDVLILAGDIMIAENLHDHSRPTSSPTFEEIRKMGKQQLAAHRFREFFDRVSFEFPNVIYIAGNHEFYHGRWNASIDHLRQEVSAYSNIHFLERDSITIDGIVFLGTTLWTDLNRNDPITVHAISSLMNDYRVVRVDDDTSWGKLRPYHTLQRHRSSLHWLENKLKEHQHDRVVVITHHTPSFQSCAPSYKHDRVMNGGYHSELSYMIADNPQIATWICGHTHVPHSYWIENTLLVCNPKGYSSWDPDAESFKLVCVDLNNMPEKFSDVKWGRE